MEKKDYSLMYDIENFYWYWLGKKDLIKKMLDRFVQKKERLKLKILDVGCGTGSVLEFLKGKGELYGTDVSDFALKHCKKRGDFKLKKMNAENLKFPKEYFDVIILSDIIEHVNLDRKVIQQCYKIVKKNGIVIVTVPAHKSLWNDDDVRLGHKRRYSKNMLKSVAKPFKIKKLSYIHFFMFPLVLIARIMEQTTDKKGTMEMRMKNNLQKGALLDALVNRFLTGVNKIENLLLSIMNLPAGVGLLMILKKGE